MRVGAGCPGKDCVTRLSWNSLSIATPDFQAQTAEMNATWYDPKPPKPAKRRLGRLTTMAMAALLACPLVLAHGGQAALGAPPALAVSGVLPAPPAGVAELRFSEMFQRPVGPKGLEPSARLLALDGLTVRLVGYMASAELPMAGRLVLSPLPIAMGDEDEPLADDLPAQAIFVHLSGPAAAHALPNYSGLIQLQGRLSVGARDEPNGHLSSVRLLLDEQASQQLVPPAALRRLR